MTNGELRLLVDVIAKYVVLFAFTLYVGIYIWTLKSRPINLPDWLVMLYTLIFQYYFRKSPKEDK